MGKRTWQTLASMAIVATTAVAGADGPITLAPVRHVGDEFHWIQRSNLFSNILPVGVQTKVDEKVTEVAADGSYTIAVTQGKSLVSWAFEELSSPEDPIKSSFRCNARGEIVEVDADPIYVEWTARAHNLETAIVPEHPVSPGDTWTYDFAANPKTGAVAAHGVYKLTKATDGLVTVEIDVRETEGISPASCTGEVILRLSDLAPQSLNLKLKDAPVPGLPGLGTGTFSQRAAG